MTKNTYYDTKLQQGLEYQDYVAVQLAKRGIPITSFSSKKYQIAKGENMQGYEIKNDQRFRETGNLWIETEERSNVNNPYFPSGIFRNDNTIFYLIGDYDGAYLMQKKVLQAMAAKESIRENNMKTSKGFLLSTEKAGSLFNYIEFEPNL